MKYFCPLWLYSPNLNFKLKIENLPVIFFPLRSFFEEESKECLQSDPAQSSWSVTDFSNADDMKTFQSLNKQMMG